ncbi:putative retrotransposon hot spot (RHS) protein, partial [Trypanosoma conorhini]
MPGRRGRGRGGGRGRPTSNVPQGQQRARSAPHSDLPQPHWTLHSAVEEVLLWGQGQLSQITLNDFLRNTLGGRGVLEDNENLSIEAFIVSPNTFIEDENVLRLILSLPSYKAIEDAYKLMDHRVGTLQRWKGFAQKEIVSNASWAKLDAALAAAEANERAGQAEQTRVRQEEEERRRREERERIRREEEESRARLEEEQERAIREEARVMREEERAIREEARIRREEERIRREERERIRREEEESR